VACLAIVKIKVSRQESLNKLRGVKKGGKSMWPKQGG